MCLYPKRIINKKYTVTKKNGGNVPELKDERLKYVQVPCGQCIECRTQKANQWKIRLAEELQEHNYAYFVTLTFSPAGLREVCFKSGLTECNAAAEYALRHCLEKWRKQYKKSLCHWMITELGHEGTERIHMHGIIFSDIKLEFTESENKKYKYWKYWKYGLVYVGDYCNLQSVNYIVKYMTKIDKDHKGFIGQVLASPGIGISFINNGKAIVKIDDKGHIFDTYTLRNGQKVKLPTYYKSKLYSEEERERNWQAWMDEGKTTIAGNTYYDHIDGMKYENIQKKGQENNQELGYGSDSFEWRKKEWNITKRMLRDQERRNQEIKMAEAIYGQNSIEVEKIRKKMNEKFAQIK